MASDTPQPYGGASNVASQDRYNTLAIVGFVLAFVVNIAGLIVSIIAFRQVKQTGEKGRGLALAGIIISILSLVIGIIVVILYVIAAAALVHSGTTSP